MELSIEQQFDYESFARQVEKMSEAQAKEFLLKTYKLMILKEAFYKHFIKEKGLF